MNFPETFQDVKLLALDTSPLIYYIEENPKYDKLITEVFEGFERGDFQIIVSSLTVTEVMSLPVRRGNHGLANSYYRLLTETIGLKVVAADTEIAHKAANLRAKYSLKTIDAIHLATAIVAGCDAFLTNDYIFKRVTELRVLILDDLQNETLSR